TVWAADRLYARIGDGPGRAVLPRGGPGVPDPQAAGNAADTVRRADSGRAARECAALRLRAVQRTAATSGGDRAPRRHRHDGPGPAGGHSATDHANEPRPARQCGARPSPGSGRLAATVLVP